MATPTCFISYSWDSDAHKDWVRRLADALRNNGVDTRLDQWDLRPGMDVTTYMERCVRESTFVLLVCTPTFAQKANTGKGGVGYEKAIVTGEIFGGSASPEKFVPILRAGEAKESLPSYLKSKLFMDFRDDNKFQANLEQLLRNFYESPLYARPPLGTRLTPAPASSARPNIVQDESKTSGPLQIPSTEPEFCEETRRVLGIADQVRNADKTAYIMSTHLLLASYVGSQTDAAFLFLSIFGMQLAELIQIQSNPREVSSLLQTKFETPVPDNLERFQLSDAVKDALNTAKQLVQTKQSAMVESYHLFAGLLNTPEASAIKWLDDVLGKDVTDWMRRALREWDEKSPLTLENIQTLAVKAGLYTAPTGVSDNAAETDLLDFVRSADSLANIILREETVPPLVVGIYGPWGSGKSTFMQLVKKSLESKAHVVGMAARLLLWRRLINWIRSWPLGRRPTASSHSVPELIIVEYDAWAYADAPKLWAGLIAKIAKELDAQLGFRGRVTYMIKYRMRQLVGAGLLGLIPVTIYLAGPFLIGTIPGMTGSPLLADWLAKISTGFWIVFLFLFQREPVSANIQTLAQKFDTQPISGVVNSIQSEVKNAITTRFPQSKEGATSQREYTRDDVAQSVRANKLKIVVLIDELDRCPLERVVDILEAIKLFLSEELFIVLMAIDTRVAAEAIRLHYKDVQNPDLPHEYLEKIVQLPLQVPTASNLERYLRQYMPTAATALDQIRSHENNPTETSRSQVIQGDAALSSTPSVRKERPLVLRQSSSTIGRPKFSDTPVEFEMIDKLSAMFLESNPRRIKRLLNTYRYVKMLANARGEPIDSEEWQKTMLAWLAFTIRCPAFIDEALERLDDLDVQRYPGKSMLEIALAKSDSACPKPTPEEIREYLPIPTKEQLSLLRQWAGNFLIEIPLMRSEAARSNSDISKNDTGKKKIQSPQTLRRMRPRSRNARPKAFVKKV